MDKIIGIKGMKGNLPSGVGFIIIPDNIDIEKYKQDVYRTGRVSIFGGYGHSNFYDVPINDEDLQKIEFPKKVGEMGTPVVWINIPKHDKPVIVATLKYDDVPNEYSEFRKRITRTFNGNVVDLDLDAKKSRIGITAVGDNEPMEFIIDINSKNEDATFKINVNGEKLERSTGRNITISHKSIELAVADNSGISKARIKLSPKPEENQFTYEDENKNSVIINKDEINIRADESSKINFGDGKEKMVLGDTLKKILERLDDADAQATYPTAFGPTGTRINQASYTEIRKDFEKILSKLTNTD